MTSIEQTVENGTPLKIALFRSLGQRLLPYKFDWNAARDNFARRHDGVTHTFQVTVLDAKVGYRIQPGVSVRIEQVEKIFHQTSGFEAKYQADTPTMGTRVGSIIGAGPRDCEFLLESATSLDEVTDKLISAFEKVALPYFEQWSSLTNIDTELNDAPDRRTLHRSLAWFRCSTGIIVAKLVNRPNYDQLAAFYTGVMVLDNKGFYLKRFEALLKSLETVVPGSGLKQNRTQ